MSATVLGRYELLRLLGRGGMADIYLARRVVAGLEKRLVIKRVRPERAGDTTFLELFVREARLSMTLNHQNIVPVFDFGRVGDAAFLAMEHVEGRDLGETLRRASAPLSPLLAAFIAAECCQALDHAHRRCAPDGTALGVVHRDVTPRNVLLSWSGEVKLTDFGVAALAGDPGGDVRGTVAYMAPEQARYEPTDARADLYALGLVLWEMVAGQRVRRFRNKGELLEATRAGVLPPLPEAPPALVEVIERATRRDPAERFADARQLLEALDRYLVEARAADPGPAPARQLADWLAEVWGEEAGKVEGEPLAGGAGAGVGVGASAGAGGDAELDPATMKSMALTAPELDAIVAAEDAAAQEAARAAQAALAARAQAAAAAQPRTSVVAAPGGSALPSAAARAARPGAVGAEVVLPAGAPTAGPAGSAGSAAASGSSVSSASSASRSASSSPSPSPATSSAGPAPLRRFGPALALLVVALLVVVTWRSWRGERAATPTGDAGLLAIGLDAAAVAPADAATADDGLTGAPPPGVTVDAASPTVVAVVPGGDAGPRRPPPDGGAALDAGIDAAATLTRRVTIGATPWADFTVDDDPTPRQTPETLELTPGRHRIHFSNPRLGVTRTVVIDVPSDRDLKHVEALDAP